jgi:hypothetical protein
MRHPRHRFRNRIIPRRSYIPDTDSETESFQGERIEVVFVFDGNVHNDVVRSSSLSFPAGCASSVLARIRSAEERERSERARDHQTVNGEQLFMSVTSAECTEVEYATKRYTESRPPNSTKTDNGNTSTRKMRRGFAQHIQVELSSSSDEAPTSSRSIFLREIHCQIGRNEKLQRRLAHSTKLLRNAERIAIGEGNAPAPQAIRPLTLAMSHAPIPPLDWRQLCSSKCPGPPRRRMRPAKITRHKVCFQRTFLRRFRA